MTTVANTVALVALGLIRFGGRGGGEGFALLVVGLVMLALVAVDRGDALSRDRGSIARSRTELSAGVRAGTTWC